MFRGGSGVYRNSRCPWQMSNDNQGFPSRELAPVTRFELEIKDGISAPFALDFGLAPATRFELETKSHRLMVGNSDRSGNPGMVPVAWDGGIGDGDRDRAFRLERSHTGFHGRARFAIGQN